MSSILHQKTSYINENVSKSIAIHLFIHPLFFHSGSCNTIILCNYKRFMDKHRAVSVTNLCILKSLYIETYSKFTYMYTIKILCIHYGTKDPIHLNTKCNACIQGCTVQPWSVLIIEKKYCWYKGRKENHL